MPILCTGELTQKGPAPTFLLVIAQQPPGGVFSNLAHVCSSPGKFHEFGVVTFQPIREVT